VKLIGEPNPDTAYVMDLKELSDLVQAKVISKFDHKNLNLDTVEFKNLNPTAENIAIVIYDLLRPEIDSKLDLKIRLYETPRNFVEYPVD
jgi:6-pyruvoyltetrahydropterin/6-carboxytetrahydropterin synthase